jgi:hypothetical protein
LLQRFNLTSFFNLIDVREAMQTSASQLQYGHSTRSLALSFVKTFMVFSFAVQQGAVSNLLTMIRCEFSFALNNDFLSSISSS